MSIVGIRERTRPDKFHEEWLHHRGEKSSAYTMLWVVLRGSSMYFFKNEKTDLRENLLGSLRLDLQTAFTADKKRDKRFEIESYSRDGIKRRNYFKCKDSTSRDLWKCFIIGVATGVMPQDVHLLPGQIHKVEDAIQYMFKGSTPSQPGPPLPPRPRTGSVGGVSTGSKRSDGSAGGSGDRTSSASSVSVQSAGSPFQSSGSTYQTTLPETRHKFYKEEERNSDVPSWFFQNCSREKAEQLLEYGKRYGSCLMRESTSHRQTGSYVISYRKDIYGGRYEFCHYEVARVAEGYLIVLENEPQRTSRCLSDVMSYFTGICGGDAVPMKTHDWAILGAKYPDYSTRMSCSLPTNRENGETEHIQQGGSVSSSVRTSRSSTGSDSASSYQRNWEKLSNRTSQDSGYYNLNEYFPPYAENDKNDYVNEEVIEALREDFDQEDYTDADVFEETAAQIMSEQEEYENEQQIMQLRMQLPRSQIQRSISECGDTKSTPSSANARATPPNAPPPPPISTIPHRTTAGHEPPSPSVTPGRNRESESYLSSPVTAEGAVHGSAYRMPRQDRRFSEPAIHVAAGLRMAAAPLFPQPDEMIGELQKKLNMRRAVVDSATEEIDNDIPTEQAPPPPIQSSNVNAGRPLPVPPRGRPQSTSAMPVDTPHQPHLQHSESDSAVIDHQFLLRQRLQEKFIYSTPGAFMKK